MRGLLVLALVSALAHDAAAQPAGGAGALVLEVRVFNGADEVTPHTRLTVHKAGERKESIPHSQSEDGRVVLSVPPGIYDVQAMHVRDGRVLNIRWANRLVVMGYPDEAGHHLEVINFKNGYGALQVRRPGSGKVEATIFETGKRAKPAAAPLAGRNYILFIVPAGLYDLQTRIGGALKWHSGVEVPLDRTRLSIIE